MEPIRLADETNHFVIYLTKDSALNLVRFELKEVVGEYADGEPMEADTTFYGHFGYDLCIHLKTKAKYGYKDDGIAHYHHFCTGSHLVWLGQFLEAVQDKLEAGLIPDFKPVI
jgi:hypothetical protein